VFVSFGPGPIDGSAENLARWVLKLAPLRGYTPQGHPVRLLASLVIEDGLWGFASGARAKMEADRNRKITLKRDLANYGED
jgi:hypothetical protein